MPLLSYFKTYLHNINSKLSFIKPRYRKSIMFYGGILLTTSIFLTIILTSELSLVHLLRTKPSPLHSPLALANTPHLRQAVLGAVVTPIPTITPYIHHVFFINSFTASPTPKPILLSKKSYSIAIIGDSMVDTMGERLEYLEHILTKKYPQTDFHLYNYGIGSQNIEEGLARFNSPFAFRDRHYPALTEVKPDILIVASFAYNPFNPYDRNKHWLDMITMVKAAKLVSPQVYVLAEIAPLINDFGKGPGGVNWPDPFIHAHHIIEQLENAEGAAKEEHVGLIDAFVKSQTNSQHEGNKIYVNTNDGIHPSIAGHEFMANLIANTISF